jgi:hypothetical protein
MFRRIIVFVVLVHGVTPLVRAQTANGSEAQARKAISGIWSTVFAAADHPAWKIEDHFCGAIGMPFCSRVAQERLRALLADPANDKRPLPELAQQAQIRGQFVERLMTDDARKRRAHRNDPAADPEPGCPLGPDLISQLITQLPVAIHVHDDHVVMQYDGSDTVRRSKITDEWTPSADGPTPFGASTARFEGATLIVESRNITGSRSRFFPTTDGTRVVERYALSDDGTQLNLELTIDDRATFREPLVLFQSRVRTPDETILGPLPCEASQ